MNNQSDIHMEQPVLKRLAEHALEKIGRIDAELSIALVDAETIRGMNKAYRGIDRPTDVLSFNLEDEDNFLGDVVISPEVAKGNASEFGADLASEIRLLLVHGILHLNGLDHESPSDAVKMEKIESDILLSFDELMS